MATLPLLDSLPWSALDLDLGPGRPLFDAVSRTLCTLLLEPIAAVELCHALRRLMAVRNFRAFLGHLVWGCLALLPLVTLVKETMHDDDQMDRVRLSVAVIAFFFAWGIGVGKTSFTTRMFKCLGVLIGLWPMVAACLVISNTPLLSNFIMLVAPFLCLFLYTVFYRDPLRRAGHGVLFVYLVSVVFFCSCMWEDWRDFAFWVTVGNIPALLGTGYHLIVSRRQVEHPVVSALPFVSWKDLAFCAAFGVTLATVQISRRHNAALYSRLACVANLGVWSAAALRQTVGLQEEGLFEWAEAAISSVAGHGANFLYLLFILPAVPMLVCISLAIPIDFFNIYIVPVMNAEVIEWNVLTARLVLMVLTLQPVAYLMKRAHNYYFQQFNYIYDTSQYLKQDPYHIVADMAKRWDGHSEDQLALIEHRMTMLNRANLKAFDDGILNTDGIWEVVDKWGGKKHSKETANSPSGPPTISDLRKKLFQYQSTVEADEPAKKQKSTTIKSQDAHQIKANRLCVAVTGVSFTDYNELRGQVRTMLTDYRTKFVAPKPTSEEIVAACFATTRGWHGGATSAKYLYEIMGKVENVHYQRELMTHPVASHMGSVVIHLLSPLSPSQRMLSIVGCYISAVLGMRHVASRLEKPHEHAFASATLFYVSFLVGALCYFLAGTTAPDETASRAEEETMELERVRELQAFLTWSRRFHVLIAVLSAAMLTLSYHHDVNQGDAGSSWRHLMTYILSCGTLLSFINIIIYIALSLTHFTVDHAETARETLARRGEYASQAKVDRMNSALRVKWTAYAALLVVVQLSLMMAFDNEWPVICLGWDAVVFLTLLGSWYRTWWHHRHPLCAMFCVPIVLSYDFWNPHSWTIVITKCMAILATQTVLSSPLFNVKFQLKAKFHTHDKKASQLVNKWLDLLTLPPRMCFFGLFIVTALTVYQETYNRSLAMSDPKGWINTFNTTLSSPEEMARPKAFCGGAGMLAKARTEQLANACYSVCDRRWGVSDSFPEGVDVMDLTLAASLAYHEVPANDPTHSVLQFINKDVDGRAGDWQVRYRNDHTRDIVRFMDLYSPSRKLSIIAIRGSSARIIDWMQDFSLFGESKIFDTLKGMVPFINYYPTFFFQGFLQQYNRVVQGIYQSMGQEKFYAPVVTYAMESLAAEQREMVFTGHSLGGALAKVTAALVGRDAVAVSAPGVFDTRDKYTYGAGDSRRKVSAFDLRRFVTTLMNDGDIVTGAGKQSGEIHELYCSDGALCHMISKTVCELWAKCPSGATGFQLVGRHRVKCT